MERGGTMIFISDEFEMKFSESSQAGFFLTSSFFTSKIIFLGVTNFSTQKYVILTKEKVLFIKEIKNAGKISKKILFLS